MADNNNQFLDSQKLKKSPDSGGAPYLSGPSERYQSKKPRLGRTERRHSRARILRKKLRPYFFLALFLVAVATFASLFSLSQKGRRVLSKVKQSLTAKDPAVTPTPSEKPKAEPDTSITKMAEVKTLEISGGARGRLFSEKAQGSPDENVVDDQQPGEVEAPLLDQSIKMTEASLQAVDEATLFFLDYTEASHDWQRVSELVRNKEAMIPKMKAFYAKKGRRLPELAHIAPASVLHISWKGKDILRCDMDLVDFDRRVAFLVRANDESPWQLDWESFVHYLPRPWESMLKGRPEGEHVLRVVLEASDYYSQPFSDRSQYASWSLSRITEGDSLNGYVERDSKLYHELIDALGEGDMLTGRRVMVGIRFPKNTVSPRQVKITRLVSAYWLEF